MADLQGIFEWIARDSAEAAGNVVERLLDAVDSLQQFPERYAVIETRRKLPWPVRRFPNPPYRILYRIDDRLRAVYVLAVRHGRQGPWP